MTTTNTKETTKKATAKKTTKAKKPAEQLEKVETEIVVQANQTQFPQFLEDSLAVKKVEIIDTDKLAKRLATSTEYIRKEANNVVKSFCRIGFKLWEVREEKLYLGQEFKNVYEYGEKVLGFQKSSVKNYIAICERFSVHKNDKPTAQLLSDFASFSYGQLSLMLSVPDEKLPEITPDATCKQIREMKNATKSDSDQDGGENEPLQKYLNSARPPIQIFSRTLTDQNIDLVIKLLRENLSREIQILVEDDEPVSGGGGDAMGEK